MIVKSLISKIISNITVEAKGGYPSRLINDIVAGGLDIWDINYNKSAVVFKTVPRQYFAIKPIARKNQCRIKVIKKTGVLFKTAKYKKLIPFTLMLAVYIAFTAYLGTKVVDVSVVGNKRISDNEIKQLLLENDITFMSQREDVDVGYIENYIMQNVSDLSWVSLNLSYGRLLVEVQEKTIAPISDYKSINKFASSDYDAVVSSIELKSGESLVTVGDVVSAGQIIAVSTPASGEHSWVSGINGEILGLVNTTISKTYDLTVIERFQTGKTVNVPAIINKSPNEFAAKKGFQYYDYYIKEKPINIFGVKLPYNIKVLTLNEISQQTVSRSGREVDALYAEYTAEYENQAGGRILSKNTARTDKGDSITFTTTYAIEKNLISLG